MSVSSFKLKKCISEVRVSDDGYSDLPLKVEISTQISIDIVVEDSCDVPSEEAIKKQRDIPADKLDGYLDVFTEQEFKLYQISKSLNVMMDHFPYFHHA